MSPPFTSGLNGLVNLTRLNLSYNQINNLTGEMNTKTEQELSSPNTQMKTLTSD